MKKPEYKFIQVMSIGINLQKNRKATNEKSFYEREVSNDKFLIAFQIFKEEQPILYDEESRRFINITYASKTEKTNENKKRVLEYSNYSKARQCT